MRKKLKLAAITFAMAFAPMAALAFAPTALAVDATTPDIAGQLDRGSCLSTTAEGAADCQAVDAEGNVNSLIADVINIFSLVVGVVSVIMIIIGGFRYITSGGDSSNVSNAKNTILYAIIGLVIVALAQFIVRFVLSRVTTGTE